MTGNENYSDRIRKINLKNRSELIFLIESNYSDIVSFDSLYCFICGHMFVIEYERLYLICFEYQQRKR